MKKVAIAVMIMICSFYQPAAAERMAVAEAVANIRSGPGATNPVIWKIEKYHPVEVIQTKGAWYQFEDFEKDRGWIHQSLLNKTKTVITKNKTCNLRSGPGTDHSIVFTVEKGIPFRVVKTSGAWILVEHADGDQGWISRSLVW
jgi:SH3-like domain-containing protein